MKVENPIFNGEWTTKWEDKYVVTGVDREGRRFRRTTDTYAHAKCINVYRGSRWLVRKINGKSRRFLIERIIN